MPPSESECLKTLCFLSIQIGSGIEKLSSKPKGSLIPIDLWMQQLILLCHFLNA